MLKKAMIVRYVYMYMYSLLYYNTQNNIYLYIYNNIIHVHGTCIHTHVHAYIFIVWMYRYKYNVFMSECFLLFQTPFTFNNRPLKKMKNECNRVDMPRTKTSLLDFHASEGLTKQDMYDRDTVVIAVHVFVVLHSQAVRGEGTRQRTPYHSQHWSEWSKCCGRTCRKGFQRLGFTSTTSQKEVM